MTQQPDAREVIARAFHKARGLDPDCLFQHEEGDPWPTDARLSNGKPAHYGWRQSLRHTDASLAALEAAGRKVVKVEPTEEMLNAGEYANSEWLNDNAPLGQRAYREPAKAVYCAMVAASP